MPARIQQMSQHLANQIAAGEVIERPASIVKECLENSLDAGATAIELQVEGGGTRFLQITDNGSGIHPDDLTLAVAPHATSKLTSTDQLLAIETLGFRGEALASIAAIAKFRLQSRAIDMAHAYEIDNQISGELAVQPSSHPQGTTVTIKDLFYNVPARKAFLRSERTEFHHIEEVVRKIALSHPAVRFHLQQAKKTICLFPGASSTQDRVKQLLGKAFLEQAQAIDAQAVGLKLSGYLGHPDQGRSQADRQYFFVNGRMVRDKLLMHAVRQAYGETLYAGRYPCYVLYLEVEPNSIDVNVHPTKHEIRFRQTRLVHDFLSQHLQAALGTKPAQETIQTYSPPIKPQPSPAKTILPIEKTSWGLLKQRTAAPPVKPLKTISVDMEYWFLTAEQWIIVQQQREAVLIHAGAAFTQLCAWCLETQGLTSKPLLLPTTLTLTPEQMVCYQHHNKALHALGVTSDCIGEQQIVVRALPSLFQYTGPSCFFDKLLNNLSAQSELERAAILAAVPDSFTDYPRAEMASLIEFAMQLPAESRGLNGQKIRTILTHSKLDAVL